MSPGASSSTGATDIAAWGSGVRLDTPDTCQRAQKTAMCRKNLKLGVMHKRQEGQEDHLPILVESLTWSFLWTPHSFPRLCPWQLLSADAATCRAASWGYYQTPTSTTSNVSAPGSAANCILKVSTCVRRSSAFPWLESSSPRHSYASFISTFLVLGK